VQRQLDLVRPVLAEHCAPPPGASPASVPPPGSPPGTPLLGTLGAVNPAAAKLPLHVAAHEPAELLWRPIMSGTWVAFSAHEDAIILDGVKRLGARWRQIATLMPGRSESSVRNRHVRLTCAAKPAGSSGK